MCVCGYVHGNVRARPRATVRVVCRRVQALPARVPCVARRAAACRHVDHGAALSARTVCRRAGLDRSRAVRLSERPLRLHRSFGPAPPLTHVCVHAACARRA
eukprot:960406-Prymnesium_polylepis.6